MKILFINKYDKTGGAAITASRLDLALKKFYHTQNKFIVGIKKTNKEYISATRKNALENFLERGINFLTSSAGLQYKFLPISTNRIIKTTKIFSPDIINLHNIHGGYFKTSLLIELSKIAPIVWTLHDMWAFTSNAAHSFGDESWKNLKSGKNENKHFPKIGINTGNWLLRKKKIIYDKSDLTIVCPSKWLMNLATQSPLFAKKKIVHIPNGIDTNTFKNYNKEEIRKEFNIPIHSKVLVFSAEKVFNNEYKGGKDLIKILDKLDYLLNEKIHLIIIGDGNFKPLRKYQNFILHFTGYINSELLIAKYLSTADIFIYPTRADNLPNSLIEASSCGTPSVTFDVGGCEEIIVDGYNGYLIPKFNLDLFVTKTIELLQSSSKLITFSNNARLLVMKNFTSEEMSKKYYNLFYELIN